MTPHLHVVAGVGGRIGAYMPARPTVAPTVTVRDNAGTALVTAQATTAEGVDTTVAAATAAGARVLTLASGAGVVAGHDYEFGPNNAEAGTEPTETVRVLSIAAAVATLARPVLHAHVAGAGFRSTLAVYDVLAAAVPASFTFGRAEFTWIDLLVLTQVATVRLDCLPRQHEGYRQRRYPRTHTSEQDLFDRAGRLELLVPENADVRAMMRASELSVLGWLDHRLGRGRNVVGGDAIVDAAAWWTLREMWAQNTLLTAGNPFDVPLEGALSDLLTVGADENQNGTVEIQPREARGIAGLPPP